MTAPPRPSGGVVRKIRRRLWKAQGGSCFWCQAETILPEDLLREYIPLDSVYQDGFADQLDVLVQQLMSRVPEFKRRWFNEVATIDHVIEQAAGGSWDEENLVAACYRCNHERGVRFHKRQQLLAQEDGE